MANENELINPKQAHNAAQVKKEQEDKKKIRVSNEKVFFRGNKKLKRISFERNIDGKWFKDHSKIIYLGKKSKQDEE
jgi:hypothetical protein